jgi:ATP-dependent RNA helicase RhlE
MLDIGFLPDLQRILSYLPKQRQTLLFSATFSPEIRRLSQSYLQDPLTIEVARPNATATNVEQHFFSVPEDEKRRAVRHLLKERSLSQAIIFVNSKLGAARLARAFEHDGLKTAALHGDKSQDERLKSLAAFKRGEVDLLVATDVAARGLDIVDLPAVFNYDVPFNAEDYVHRIGRTGRAGASGVAITLATRDDARTVAEIEKLIKRKFEIEPLEMEDEQPVRRRRPYEDDRSPRERSISSSSATGERASAERGSSFVDRSGSERVSIRPAMPSRAADPFFDKPYEPSGNGDAAWERRGAASAAARVTSLNIRPKRKVAALLGGVKA